MAKMSDSEVSSKAFHKLMGDLDHIEADGIFAEKDNPENDPISHGKGVTVTAHGVNVNIVPMDGEQTKMQPKIEAAPKDDEDKSVLGK
jgi:hypothetical protein